MNPRFITLLLIILALAVFRIIPHPPNVSPVAAMALFAGAHFADRRVAFLVPLAALLVSDLVIGLHATMLFVYAAFGLTVVIGLWLRDHKGALPVMGAALSGSVLFFVVTNFGTWLVQDLYAHSPAGLAAAYTAALPFFRHTLLGDLAFTALLFGGFALAQRQLAMLRPAHSSLGSSV